MLASQDVIVHVTFYIIFLIEYYDIRKVHTYTAKTQLKKPSPNMMLAFRIMMRVHLTCLLIHIITEVLAFVGKLTLQFLRKFLVLVKVMTYLFGVIKVQGMLIKDLTKDANGKLTKNFHTNNFVEVLLLFDISFFYFSIFALMIFNTLIRCRKFHTIKERIVGNTERFKAINGDSLYFAREDLHYITIVFARFCLFIFVEINRVSN